MRCGHAGGMPQHVLLGQTFVGSIRYVCTVAKSPLERQSDADWYRSPYRSHPWLRDPTQSVCPLRLVRALNFQAGEAVLVCPLKNASSLLSLDSVARSGGSRRSKLHAVRKLDKSLSFPSRKISLRKPGRRISHAAFAQSPG